MKPLRLPLGLLFCVLVRFGLAQECDWDIHKSELLASDSARRLGDPIEVSNPEECQEQCCEKADCDAALVGYPADAPHLLCELLSCSGQDQDHCALTDSSQFQFYRKTAAGSEPLLTKAEPKTNDTNNINCRLPSKVGSCRAAFPRFYYDVTNQTCRRFTYGGCGANANNFETQEECEVTCSGVTGSVLPDDSTPAPSLEYAYKNPRRAVPFNQGPVETEAPSQPKATEMSAEEYAEKCGAEPEVGFCRAAFQRWYYNRKSGECKSFIYGGCKGNKNNYVTEKSCKDTCAVSVLPSSKKSPDDEVSTKYRDECMVSPDAGPCRASFLNFYYDHQTGSCQSFLYGGCRGNANRYLSPEECMDHCSDDGTFYHQARKRWTAASFLFVTLAVISALLLVTLFLITMRRRRLSRRLSTSDKEELLPSEQSSVESLTLPPSPKPQEA
ncbi:kunitz-type protease inhibitor 2 [Solea solea]|uniref:kunitz-type protease inhibitor 2 n=1 Tax=Solea solea TaxID=90069 RepID=UPI00272C89D6|nr:kunitz-type protease inhibitor 2 [Solea solea]